MASTLNQAMSTLGAVTDATRAKAEATWLACHLALGRAPGVLWGKGSSSEHATGRAVDFMVTHHGHGLDAEMGRWITDYLLAKASDWDLAWVIWAQRLYYPDGSSYLMEDRGSTTENHYDHPHAYWRSDRLITGTKPAPSITDRLEDDMQLTDKVQLANGETTYAEAIRLNDANQQRLIADLVALKDLVQDVIAPEVSWLPRNFAAIVQAIRENPEATAEQIAAKLGGAK